MKKGDWIELRDAPNTRGIIKSVFCDTKVAMLLSGDLDLTTKTIAELEARWEPMQFHGADLPFWCQKKAIFKPIRYVTVGTESPLLVEIVDVRPGWVAYNKTQRRSPALFLMSRWWEFRTQYDPVKPPTSWDVLLNEED